MLTTVQDSLTPTSPPSSAASPTPSTPTASCPASGPVCLLSAPSWVSLCKSEWCHQDGIISFIVIQTLEILTQDPFNYISGPTFGGVLYDAITFRWAIFLILIGEFISLVRFIRMTELLKFIHSFPTHSY